MILDDRKLRVGDWVEVRSKDEILSTLDEQGRLDEMPFMPEMFAFCGAKFQVYKSAHKTCDTVSLGHALSIDSTVLLQTRCDGQAHGGCQAGCLLFWKEAWLKPVESPVTGQGAVGKPVAAIPAGSCSESDVLRATRKAGDSDDTDPTYVCQATHLPRASKELNPYDIRQYVRDLTSGNVQLRTWLCGLIYITYENMINLGIGWGPILRWLYDRFQKLVGGIPYPRRTGRIPITHPTPTQHLNLQEGEWVRVKSYADILKTCNVDNKNRGMSFDGEQVPYCGGTYRVHKRVTKILNERTGKMMQMKNPCIILDNVFCQGRYSGGRMFCPRAIFSYWREVWLERVSPQEGTSRALTDISCPAQHNEEMSQVLHRAATSPHD